MAKPIDIESLTAGDKILFAAQLFNFSSLEDH